MLQLFNPGDLLIPVSRGLTRVEDRSTAPEDYRQLMTDRIAGFKAAVAYDDRLMIPA
jgi:orotidine-5'-phosphate decarboxylase